MIWVFLVLHNSYTLKELSYIYNCSGNYRKTMKHTEQLLTKICLLAIVTELSQVQLALALALALPLCGCV